MLYTPASAIMLSFVQIAPLSGKHNNKLIIAWQIYNYLICIHGIFYFWCGYLTSLHSNCYLNVSFNVLFATLHFLCSSSCSSVSLHFFKFILNLNITHHHLFVIFLISVNVLHAWLSLCLSLIGSLHHFWTPFSTLLRSCTSLSLRNSSTSLLSPSTPLFGLIVCHVCIAIRSALI